MKLRHILPALVAAVAFAGLLAIDFPIKGDLNKANAQSTQTFDFERDRFPMPDMVVRGIRSTYVDSFTITINLSNMSQTGTAYAAVPMQGTVRGIYSVVGDGQVLGNDATIALSANGTSIGILTVAVGSQGGAVDWLTGLSQSVLTGQYFAAGSDGKPSDEPSQPLTITIVVDPVEGPVDD